MKKLSFIVLSLLTVFTFTNCSDGLDNIEYNGDSGVTITTPETTAITSISLTVQSLVSGNLNNVVRRGFCYSINNPVPTVKENAVEADENFNATISGLASSTIYYVRAYTYGNSRYTYSATLTVTTAASSIDEQLKNYVAPTYADDYTAIADWNNRGQWNLARNVSKRYQAFTGAISG